MFENSIFYIVQDDCRYTCAVYLSLHLQLPGDHQLLLRASELAGLEEPRLDVGDVGCKNPLENHRKMGKPQFLMGKLWKITMFNQKTLGKPWENDDLMGFYGIYQYIYIYIIW